MIKRELKADLKFAMKAKDEVRKGIYRYILGQIEYLEGKRTSEDGDLSDDEIEGLIRSTIKGLRLNGTIESRKEISILEDYLPPQMDNTQINLEVLKIIAHIGPVTMKDIGRVMGEFNKKFKGKADGKAVSAIVKQKLS